MRALFTILLVASVSLSHAGCVIREIRDDIRANNAQVKEVNAKLASTRDAIEHNNATLTNVEHGLARLDTTNNSLTGVEARLYAIDVSLSHVDAHLASLRKTIGSLDHMIPFVDLGSDDAVLPTAVAAAPAAPATTAPVAAEAAEAAPPAETSPAAGSEQSPPRRDIMIGAWVSEYPDRSVALVLLPGGRYLWQAAEHAAPADAKRTTESGTWKMTGTQLVLAPEAPAAAAAAGAGGQSAPPAARTFEVILRSARSLTLQAADGRLMIFGKP